MIAGGCLLAWAKFPTYRAIRLFTFGIKSVPTHLADCYRWIWRLFVFGLVSNLCLLLSKP